MVLGNVNDHLIAFEQSLLVTKPVMTFMKLLKL